MRVEDLSGNDATVYRVVAELEDASSAPHLQDIAGRAGLDVEETRAALHRLMNSEPSLVHETPDPSRTEVGPVYELAPRGT
ncbi:MULTISPECIES: hypothetical protein [unclassified Modestobacter]|uniref:hypothetical protein n=1 Tax=unclassified Modestobacter TaxID=2643866 RepID=UPI0022AAE0A7|nr:MULTISPECIES: hypothetical protein [unclassified Modestobacter]MCZ2826790.1 hypothetical protein [Modestobacter sp. VKM Ac-2981]MCZ2855170.1 hypothetical protein [Modestobacter sp. VKM Ac-2982]